MSEQPHKNVTLMVMLLYAIQNPQKTHYSVAWNNAHVNARPTSWPSFNRFY